MNDHAQTLADLGQGQAVCLTFDDGTVVEVRANQIDYQPEERLRLELSTDESGDSSRYQAFASAEGGEWSPVDVRRYDGEPDEWTDLPQLTDVTPLDERQFHESEDEPGGRA